MMPSVNLRSGQKQHLTQPESNNIKGRLTNVSLSTIINVSVFYLEDIAGQRIGCYTMDKVGLRKGFELDGVLHISTSVWLPDRTTPLLAFILASKVLCPLPQSVKLGMQSVDSNLSVQFHATFYMHFEYNASFKSEQFNISVCFCPYIELR